uniref:PAM2 domain-containing protein n=1 Tax=Ascaris lumbricoides TaxID=6252 RepID=A0A0M3I819_ASCLU
MSSYFSYGRQPGLFGNSVYFPAERYINDSIPPDNGYGKLAEIQGRKPTAGIMNAARGDMSEGFPRIAGFEYVNPRGAAPLGGLQNSGSLGGFQNYMRSPDYTSLARDSPASTYGAYSTFQSGGILDQKSSIVPQDKTSVKQPPTQVWGESRWAMPTKLFNDSSYAFRALNNNIDEMEQEHMKHLEEMERLQKEAEHLRSHEEDESLLTAMDKMSVTNEVDPSISAYRNISPHKQVRISAADVVGHDKGGAVSDSVYFSVPNMHNAFSGNLHPQTSQPVETKYAVENAPKVELAESVHREHPPQVATLITQDISSDTETAIETQLPKVFADSTYAFDADTETTANKLAEELPETQSDDDEQLVTVSPITDHIKTPISTGLQEVKTTYVGSEYSFEELRGLEAFGAR